MSSHVLSEYLRAGPRATEVFVSCRRRRADSEAGNHGTRITGPRFGYVGGPTAGCVCSNNNLFIQPARGDQLAAGSADTAKGAVGRPIANSLGMVRAFRGAIIHAPFDGFEQGLELLSDALLIVNDEGDIVNVQNFNEVEYEKTLKSYGIDQIEVVVLGEFEAILPGFIDVHLHAPQYSFTGTATDMPLMDWLSHYTFPAESSHNDLVWAEEVYTKLVRRLLANGTTTAVYFATIHARSTMLLADICSKLGQRALIGKVNMDRNAPETYVETADESIAATELVIAHIQSKGSPEMLMPVITPRFVPTCSPGCPAVALILAFPPLAIAVLTMPVPPSRLAIAPPTCSPCAPAPLEPPSRPPARQLAGAALCRPSLDPASPYPPVRGPARLDL